MAVESADDLPSIIASYLQKRGLAKTLTTFLSESKCTLIEEVGVVDLETLYSFYMSIQASGISKKWKKKVDNAGDSSEKIVKATCQGSKEKKQGVGFLATTVTTGKAGCDNLAGEQIESSDISSDDLNQVKQQQLGNVSAEVGGGMNGEAETKRKPKKKKQHGTEVIPEHKEKLVNNGNHLQDCEKGKGEIETETCIQKEKHPKKEKLGIEASLNSKELKELESEKILEEKHKGGKNQGKVKPAGASDEGQKKVKQEKNERLESKNRTELLTINGTSEDRGRQNDEDQASPMQHKIQEKLASKEKNMKKEKKQKVEEDSEQQRMIKDGELQAVATSQQEAFASHEQSILREEVGQIKREEDVNPEVTPNKMDKKKKKHKDEAVSNQGTLKSDNTCQVDAGLQQTESKKQQEQEEMEVLGAKKFAEETGMSTKKKKKHKKEVAPKPEDLKLESKENFTGNIEEKNEKLGGEAMSEEAKTNQGTLQPEAACQVDIELQQIKTKKRQEHEEMEVFGAHKITEENGMSAKKKKKHRIEVALNTEENDAKLESKENLIGNIEKKNEKSGDEAMPNKKISEENEVIGKKRKKQKTEAALKPGKDDCKLEASTNSTGNIDEKNKKIGGEAMSNQIENFKSEGTSLVDTGLQKTGTKQQKERGEIEESGTKKTLEESAKKKKKRRTEDCLKPEDDDCKPVTKVNPTGYIGNQESSVKGTEHPLEGNDKGDTEATNGVVGNSEPATKTKKKENTSQERTPTGALAFKRVDISKVEFSDSRLQDNSYWAKAGADEGYGAKAQEVLGLVRGRDFRHEKTKKKRGSYRGGAIDLQSHSIKFDNSDEDQ